MRKSAGEDEVICRDFVNAVDQDAEVRERLEVLITWSSDIRFSTMHKMHERTGLVRILMLNVNRMKLLGVVME